MASPSEDPTTALESFINSISNLPSEIQHLYTELLQKDRLISAYRKTYLTLDRTLQNHVHKHGASTSHPRESTYTSQIRKHQSLVLQLQDEKIALAQKALDLIDKHCRSLDRHLGRLVCDGVMEAEAMAPVPAPNNLPIATQLLGFGMGRAGDGGGYTRWRLSDAGEGHLGTPLELSEARRTRKKPVDEDGEEDEGRVYCVCRQGSYGSMVGCDDKECPYEWFHWGCVQLTEEPMGKWYCAACTARRDKR